MIGKELAHYTIIEMIGAGGMGEVYRASDSKLGREVALKLLPAMFAQDAERMARFRREAKVLASLNHPNIGAIYGVEESDDSRALVLELVEGPTLLDHLGTGKVPVKEALEIALQIAEAVECAHESGIVHRDLKPANVKLTGDGRVKVLDFGLAKAMEDPAVGGGPDADDPADSPTWSPTLQVPAAEGRTAENVILGTAGYMSPEQARGKAVDKRADIWAFGVMLWEMLTGRRLFRGETISDTLAAVLRKEPDWDALPEDTPPRIRLLLRRCLERNPRERLRDMGDARLEITETLSGTGGDEATSSIGAAPGAASFLRHPWLLVAMAIVSAAVMVVILTLGKPSGEKAPLRKYEMPFPEGTHVRNAVLAPDASAVAYLTDDVLTVRELTTLEVRAIASIGDIRAPVWSPDGEWIAFGAGTGLWKVRRSGGKPIRIATMRGEEFSDVSGMAWRDRSIFFSTGNSGLFRISDQGGTPEEVVSLGKNELDFHEIADLGGKGFALIVHGEDGFGSVDVVGPDGARKRVGHYPGEALHSPAWSSTGHLLFRRSGDAQGIWAVPFSLSGFEKTGEAFLVAPGALDPSTSVDGTLGYLAGSSTDPQMLLGLVDREGKVLKVVGDPAPYYHWYTVSPDGREIACQIREAETRKLWLIDIERGSRRQFTKGRGNHTGGWWGPSGSDFYFFDERSSAEAEIWRMPASGTGDPQVVTQGQTPRVGPDGRWLLFARVYPESGERDLWLLDLSRPGTEPQPFIQDPGLQWSGTFSPTAPLIAYNTLVEGDWEVYLTTYPERKGDWPVSTHGGLWPRWRGDGRELYYAVGDSIMVVDVNAGDGSTPPQLSIPRLLFQRPQYRPYSIDYPDGYAVMPDGRTFVLLFTPSAESAPPALVVAQNWIREFRNAD